MPSKNSNAIFFCFSVCKFYEHEIWGEVLKVGRNGEDYSLDHRCTCSRLNADVYGY